MAVGTRTRVGILCGGKSAEHEVSLQSARNIVDAIDKEKYDVVVIGIDKGGQWHLHKGADFLVNRDDPKNIRLADSGEALAVVPGRSQGQLVALSTGQPIGPIDAIFPVLHGPHGEDGTVQGLLKLANIPFVGAGVLGSAAGMDKDVMKRLFRDAGLPTPRFLVFGGPEVAFEVVRAELGLPVFVKPANLGSSVGVSKVKCEEEFQAAVRKAFRYDTKILVEENIAGREIECSVLGNDAPIASIPGEIITGHGHDFYSYEAKYLDENGAVCAVPAQLERPVVERVQELSVLAFRTLCCRGLARVDCFLREDGEVLVNELNSIPGFTQISMYPKLWGASGIGYTELIDRLIQLALEQFRHESGLESSFTA